jgi:hypothetical protein
LGKAPRAKRDRPLHSLGERANSQDFVWTEPLDVRLSDGHNSDGLPQRVEDLQNAPLLAALRVLDVVDQDGYVSPPERGVGKVSLECARS